MTSFDALRIMNVIRQPVFGSQHTPHELVSCLVEELGEVAEAVAGCEGTKRSKAGFTAEDVAKELADVVTYCDLLAARYGINLGVAVREKFNEVSERIGYDCRWEDE